MQRRSHKYRHKRGLKKLQVKRLQRGLQELSLRLGAEVEEEGALPRPAHRHGYHQALLYIFNDSRHTLILAYTHIMKVCVYPMRVKH